MPAGVRRGRCGAGCTNFTTPTFAVRPMSVASVTRRGQLRLLVGVSLLVVLSSATHAAAGGDGRPQEPVARRDVAATRLPQIEHGRLSAETIELLRATATQGQSFSEVEETFTSPVPPKEHPSPWSATRWWTRTSQDATVDAQAVVADPPRNFKQPLRHADQPDDPATTVREELTEDLDINTVGQKQYRQPLSIVQSYSHEAHVMLQLFGYQRKVLAFPVRKGQTLRVVTTLPDHRFDPRVPASNCNGQMVSADLTSASLLRVGPSVSSTTGRGPASSSIAESLNDSEESSSGPAVLEDQFGDAGRASDEAPWGSIWSSFAQAFQSSIFCEVVASLGLRVARTPRAEMYYLVVETRQGLTFEYGVVDGSLSSCTVKVFYDQQPEQQLHKLQLLFAVFLPLVFMVLPLPFFLRYLDVVQSHATDTDFNSWLVFLPLLLQRSILDAASRTYTSITTWYCEYRSDQRQRHLEEQHRRLMALRELSESSSTGAAGPGSIATDGEIPVIPAGPVAQCYSAGPTPTVVVPNWVRRGTGALPIHEERQQLLNAPVGRPSGDAGRLDLHAVPVAPTVVVGEREEAPAPQGAAAAVCESDREGPAYSTVVAFSEINKPASAVFAKSHAMAKDDDDEADAERICRICRDGDEVERLVAPCECSGSVKWVHRSCLDHWRMESAKRNVNNISNCEICKKPFTLSISRATLFWQGTRNVVELVVLIACVVAVVVLTAILSHSSLGELSCAAPYNAVSYNDIFGFRGLLATIVVYVTMVGIIFMCTMFTFVRFHQDPEVLLFVQENNVFPPFWTVGNARVIVLLLLTVFAEVWAMSSLLKMLVYATTSGVWSWELSPFSGLMIYMLFLFSVTSFRDAMWAVFSPAYEWFVSRSSAHTADVVEERSDGGRNATAVTIAAADASPSPEARSAGNGDNAASAAVEPPPPSSVALLNEARGGLLSRVVRSLRYHLYGPREGRAMPESVTVEAATAHRSPQQSVDAMVGSVPRELTVVGAATAAPPQPSTMGPSVTAAPAADADASDPMAIPPDRRPIRAMEYVPPRQLTREQIRERAQRSRASS